MFIMFEASKGAGTCEAGQGLEGVLPTSLLAAGKCAAYQPAIGIEGV